MRWRTLWRRAMAAVAIASAGAVAATAQPAATDKAVRFTQFTYDGRDPGPAPGAHGYRNPILAGFYPDPSIVRVGRDYYLVTSTFAWFPGIPVMHSRDLVHWRQLGNAISRSDQLDFGHLGLSQGVFAPDISYHDGIFYIVNTCVDCGGNYIVTARNPAGPWSQPHWLTNVPGIDPSLFFDGDGSAWLVNNRAPPEPPRYPGHRAIWLQRVDVARFATVGAAMPILDAGIDPRANPNWIEGPHMFRRGRYYYLMAAEGGTGDQHSEVILRADRVTGPYRVAPPVREPILTQRDIPATRPHPVTATGHADLVTTPDGRWFAVFLGNRPYRDDLTALGRETFLWPVVWRGGWPTILPKATPLPLIGHAPLPFVDRNAPPTTGSVHLVERFTRPLGPQWMTMRDAGMPRWTVGSGGLRLIPGDRLDQLGAPAMVAHRLQHADATVSATLTAPPPIGSRAGLVAIQNDADFLTLSVRSSDDGVRLEVRRRAGPSDPPDGVLIGTKSLTTPGVVRLRMTIVRDRARFAYAAADGPWRVVADNVDATNLTAARAGGFVGTMVGPFAARAAP